MCYCKEEVFTKGPLKVDVGVLVVVSFILLMEEILHHPKSLKS